MPILTLLPYDLAICRLEPGEPMPTWAFDAPFAAVTRTPNEWSVICPAPHVPATATAEHGWTGLRVEGPLDFALTGILAGLATPLAEAGLPLFALSTYATDYLLVRTAQVDAAIAVLRAAGHTVHTSPSA